MRLVLFMAVDLVLSIACTVLVVALPLDLLGIEPTIQTAFLAGGACVLVGQVVGFVLQRTRFARWARYPGAPS